MTNRELIFFAEWSWKITKPNLGLSPHAPFGAPRIMKNRVQGAEESRIQVKGKEVKPLNPRILESSNPVFRIKVFWRN